MSPRSLQNLEAALEIIFESDSLQDLCQRAVESAAANKHYVGAHILLVSEGKLNYDCGFGQELPANHKELATLSIASHRVEVAESHEQTSPTIIAVPFMVEDVAEAIGILVLAPGNKENCLTAELGQVVTKLAGFFLQKTVGLGH